MVVLTRLSSTSKEELLNLSWFWLETSLERSIDEVMHYQLTFVVTYFVLINESLIFKHK